MLFAFNEEKKALDELLENKRLFFPRFYFLSNEELFKVITLIDQVESLQNILYKVFPSIAKLGLVTDENKTQICSIFSLYGEAM